MKENLTLEDMQIIATVLGIDAEDIKTIEIEIESPNKGFSRMKEVRCFCGNGTWRADCC